MWRAFLFGYLIDGTYKKRLPQTDNLQSAFSYNSLCRLFFQTVTHGAFTDGATTFSRQFDVSAFRVVSGEGEGQMASVELDKEVNLLIEDI